jgi:AmpD protein
MRQTMHIDTQTGLLKEAIYYPTTHYDTRSCTQDLSLVVIHAISLPPGQFDDIEFIELFRCIYLTIQIHMNLTR